MAKEYTSKEILKRLLAFTLCATLVVTTIFVGFPLSVKAADADNPYYTVGVADDCNWMVSVGNGQSNAVSNKGFLLWTGQKVVSSKRSFSEVNTYTHANHPDSPTPYIHSDYVGFTISSADENVTLDTLGDYKTANADIVTGGTMANTTPGTMPYGESFTAKTPVFLEYDDTIRTTYSTKCGCEANANWDIYQYYLYAFKVHKISTNTVSITFKNDEQAYWETENYPKNEDYVIGINDVTYTYEVPTKIGYVFDGWEFKYSDGSVISDVFNDSKDGKITFTGINGSNWKTIDAISKAGSITATPKWKERYLTLNYNPDGGVYSSSVCIVTKNNMHYETFKDYTSLFSEAKREGYTFEGWYLDDRKITRLSDIPKEKWNSSQIYNLKAKWTAVNPPDYSIDSTTGTLTVKSQNGFPAEGYGEYAKRVVVAQGITEIPVGAFEYYYMEEIELPDTLKVIDNAAFMGCVKLKSVNIPEGVTTISYKCFDSCENIEEIVLPDSVVSIKNLAFMSVGKTTTSGVKIRLSSRLESIGQSAFVNSSIKEINIPDSITTISDSIFWNAKIASFTMPPKVDKVSKNMFKNSTLAEIVLTNVKTIEEYAFYDSQITSVTIPDSVTSIGQYAFADSELQSVEIPNTVKALDSGVFAYCNQLESAKLTEGITSIPNNSFKSCTALKRLTLTNTIESIGDMAFNGVNLEEVEFAGTEEEWAALCQQAEELKAANVTYVEPINTHVHEAKLVPEVPATCIATGVKAYYTCSCGKYFEDKDCKIIISNLQEWKTGAGMIAKKGHSLKKTEAKAATCTTEGNKEYWTCSECGKIFSDAEGNTETTVSEVTIEAIGHKWDSGKVTKKPTATKTGKKTFTCTLCGETKTEEIPANGPAKVGEKITDSKTKGIYIVTKSDLKNGTVAYKETTDKKKSSVKVPDAITIEDVTYKVTSIKDDAFKSNKYITTITIGKNVTTVGKNAFYSCTKLKTVTIGSSVTTIGASVFKNCKSLTKLTLPSKTSKIGSNAFYGCSKLMTITIKSNKMTSSTISTNAFKGVSTKATIKVPKGKAKTYKSLFCKKGLSKKVKVI